MEVVLRISRFDPDKDTSPFFQKFTVSVEERQTVLDSLLLAWQQDPSLSFRRSCRSAICGSCAVRINGTPALACQTLIRTAGEDGHITIEPLPHFRQLKDLVVDLEPFFESLKAAAVPWLVLRDDYDGRMSPEVTRKLEDPATCILCGVCKAVLEKSGDIKPAGLVKALRLAQDPRDALGMDRIRLMDVPVDILKLFVAQLPEKCPKGIRMTEVV